MRYLEANYGFPSIWNPKGRLLNLQLGGGALLDVGIYTLSFSSMIFGTNPIEIKAASHLVRTGVDEQTAIVLKYNGGQMALLYCSIRTKNFKEAKIIGTSGSIYIPDFWHATRAVLKVSGEEDKQIEIPLKGNGFNFEAVEVMKCIREGKIESEIMPLDENLSIIKIMDQVRNQIGLKYPGE